MMKSKRWHIFFKINGIYSNKEYTFRRKFKREEVFRKYKNIINLKAC